MNPVEKVVRRIDAAQQRRRPLAFPYAVVKKFGDDQGGNLAALLTYYGFLSLFPLLLVFTTVLSMVLRNSPDLQQRILHSALTQFPIIGDQIQRNVHSLPASGVALAIGIAGSLYGGLGVLRATETAMNTVWNVPRKHWPNFLFSVARAFIMLLVFGFVTLLATLLSAVGTGTSVSMGLKVLGLGGSLLLNLVLFLAVFKILTTVDVSWKDVMPGAVTAAVTWTALQAVGGYFVGHQLKGSSELYGFFGVVLALLAWIYLGAQITIYAAEINVVKLRRLWPRSLVQPPLIEADQQALRHYAKQEERRPEESIDVDIDVGVDVDRASHGGGRKAR